MPVSAFRSCPGLPRALADGPDLGRRLYLIPMGMVWGEAGAAAVVAGTGWPLAGTGAVFTSIGVALREGPTTFLSVAPFPEVLEWSEREGEEVARHVGGLIHRIGGKRKPWGGHALDTPLVMGIVNATPDSFSDGGDNFDPAVAISNGLAMAEAGAAIIDVGGESTRPGALPVRDEDEMRRVLPVVSALAGQGITVSIDTRHASVMAAAVEAGATIINDVTALQGDPRALEVAARSGAAICLMHMQGQPQTMQLDPQYDCAPLDVFDYLAGRVAACVAAGIPRERIAVDPGIGFGKTVDHNAQILGALSLYHGLGCPVLLGLSRKAFIGKLSRDEPPKSRLPGTIAANQIGLDAGMQIIRVHDVPQAVQAMKIWRAVRA